MSNGRDFTAIVEAARAHYESLRADIANSKDRYEHIRLTALAQSAHNLLTDLVAFQTGLVYTHTSNAQIYVPPTTEPSISQDPLDLPEFKSPYTPPLRLE